VEEISENRMGIRTLSYPDTQKIVIFVLAVSPLLAQPRLIPETFRMIPWVPWKIWESRALDNDLIQLGDSIENMQLPYGSQEGFCALLVANECRNIRGRSGKMTLGLA
jgi:hypothetical protein